MKIYNLFFILIVSLIYSDAYADFKILGVSKSKRRIKFKTRSKQETLSVGDTLLFTNDFEEECTIEIIKVNKKYAIGDSAKCPFRSDLKRGQRLSLSDEFEDDEFEDDEFEDDEKINKKKNRNHRSKRTQILLGLFYNTENEFDTEGSLDFTADTTGETVTFSYDGKNRTSGGLGVSIGAITELQNNLIFISTLDFEFKRELEWWQRNYDDENLGTDTSIVDDPDEYNSWTLLSPKLSLGISLSRLVSLYGGVNYSYPIIKNEDPDLDDSSAKGKLGFQAGLNLNLIKNVSVFVEYSKKAFEYTNTYKVVIDGSNFTIVDNEELSVTGILVSLSIKI